MLFSCSWVNTTEVCVESVGHVIVSGDNLSSGCFEWSYVIFNYSSLIDVGIVVVVVVEQTVGFISSKTLAYDCLCTLELCTASMIATS